MTPLTRRAFIERSLLAASVGFVAPRFLYSMDEVPGGSLRPAQVLLDMVHNNPGETPFVTHYNDMAFVKSLGFKGKVFELFEGAQFGIDWSSIDPDIFPTGSPDRAWLDKKATELDQLYTAAQQAGLGVYCHTDMIVFPKRLVEKFHPAHFDHVSDPDTQRFLRAGVRQMFQRFPQVDGLVIRIGETYLQGAPYHMGGIGDKGDAKKTIIPLMQLLREEVCDKLNKKIIFRAWLSFDTSTPTYLAVSNAVEPHPNLIISIKHCEGDFHRGNPFSRVLGIGRHAQIVEVQCQREYEGKGAYPNYIAHGVIEGFEEHHGASIRRIWASPLIEGMFTWSRGGGWQGPYLTNEMWCDLNVYVMSHWAQDPNRREEDIFDDYSRQVLKLSAADGATFRKLCLLSADAIYRGIRSSRNLISPWWTRDQYMGRPPLPASPGDLAPFLAEKDQVVKMWQAIVGHAQSIQFPDPAVKEYAVTSCQYGLCVYQIYRDGFRLAALGKNGDKAAIQALISDYDATWATYRQLKQGHPSCATLYTDKSFGGGPGLGAMVDEYRKLV